MEEGPGRHIITAAAAFALSGCSLLLLSYLSYKVSALRSFSSKPTTTCIRSSERLISSAKKDCSSTVKRVQKQVRFVGVKERPSNTKLQQRKAKESGRKSNLKRDAVDEAIVSCCTGERKHRVNLPENWRRLYNGMNRYRSQQATLTVYA